ncbi:MAG TPA: hypothetical protein VL354_05105 [Spirochaetia bacterium]|nr:hypothetical protein [Spirochaetia bacterium]
MSRLRRMSAAATVALVLLASCSNKPPVISRVYARVVYQHDVVSGATTEGLSVFLVASDPDGMENLSSFYVINDDAELFWKVDNTSWVSSTAEGETWIGSNNLTMPGSQEVPAGSYRVLLQNAGGDTTEESFSVGSRDISAAQAAYPSASVHGDAIHVTGPYDSYDVWTYGKDGKFVVSFPVTRKAPDLDVRKMSATSPALAQGFSFRVFANNAKGGFGVLVGPYSVAAVVPLTQPGAGPTPAR